MTIYLDQCEMRCIEPSCGAVELMYCTVFDESTYYNSHTRIVQPKKHNTVKHFQKHLTKVQAKDNTNIPPAVIEIINNRAIAEFTTPRGLRPMNTLSCSRIRNWLHDLSYKKSRLTIYNDSVPLIRKIITSLHGEAVSAPQLTVDEEGVLSNLCADAIDVFSEIISDPTAIKILKGERSNRFYYPYFIHRILHIVYKEKKDRDKLRRLIECIHLPNDQTLWKYDKIWEIICSRLGFDYTPTIR